MLIALAALLLLLLLALGVMAYAIHIHDEQLRERLHRFDPSLTDDEIRDELGRTP